MIELTWQALVPQLFGLLGMISLFCSYQQTRREMLIACKLGADVMWVLHYIALNAYGGAIPNFVGIFRELIFIQQGRHKWARSPIWPVLFILPITASAFVTISLWVKKPKITRMIGAPVSICFIIYDICVGSWIGVINESIAIISIISSFIRNDMKQKQKGKAA